MTNINLARNSRHIHQLFSLDLTQDDEGARFNFQLLLLLINTDTNYESKDASMPPPP